MSWALDLRQVEDAGRGGWKKESTQPSNVLQVEITVPFDVKSIQSALDQAKGAPARSLLFELTMLAEDGDIIAVAPGEYIESVVVRTDVTIRTEIPSFHPPGASREVRIKASGEGSTMRVSASEKEDGKLDDGGNKRLPRVLIGDVRFSNYKLAWPPLHFRFIRSL
eukprot:765454-Hanusia_phi.AAC.3